MYRRIFGILFSAGFLCLLVPAVSHAQTPRRTLSSQITRFDLMTGVTSGECETGSPPLESGFGGTTCYSRYVKVPNDSSVLLVQVSSVGDTDEEPNFIFESVQANGVPCITGESDAVENHSGITPDIGTGWINVLALASTPAPAADNVTTYQWCCKVTPGSTQSVALKIADGVPASGDVFLESIGVTIDSAGPNASNGACGGV